MSTVGEILRNEFSQIDDDIQQYLEGKFKSQEFGTWL